LLADFAKIYVQIGNIISNPFFIQPSSNIWLARRAGLFIRGLGASKLFSFCIMRRYRYIIMQV
jgi:hypothetical protein